MPFFYTLFLEVFQIYTDIDEVKLYLRLDTSEEDDLLFSLIQSAEELCQDIIRINLNDFEIVPEVIKTAVLYAVAYLYENREQADFSDLINTLKNLLFGVREEAF